MSNQSINHNNTRIILFHERMKNISMDIYPTNHLLTYIKEGNLEFKQGNKVLHFGKGENVLLKKFTQATITKTLDKKSHKFSSIVFTFHGNLMESALTQYVHTINLQETPLMENILAIKSNPLLEQFILSLQLFSGKVVMDHNLAWLKTYEALVGVINSNENLYNQFKNLSKKNKANLYNYMNLHF